LFGEKWSEKDKTMFKNPYAQFLKIETDFVKQWNLSSSSSLLAHLNTGVIYTYGNSNQAPYYEQFYVGGANSIRAFNVRSIGPGKYKPTEGRFSYIDQTGDFKLLGNLEYRPRLFGDLFGAIFLDAGNVWSLHDDATTHRSGGKFEFNNFFKQMALGTGVGVRYDLGMFVIRLDWGIGIHVPYETGKNGFYNIKSFRDGQSIHLAVRYPF
jgi:outer membrane protein assembly factor BamA